MVAVYGQSYDEAFGVEFLVRFLSRYELRFEDCRYRVVWQQSYDFEISFVGLGNGLRRFGV